MAESRKKQRLYAFFIVGLIAVIPLSVAGFFVYEDVRSKASPAERPEEVIMSDVTNTSAILSWITPKAATEGFVRYSDKAGVSDSSLLAQDYRDVVHGTTAKRYTHYVTLTNLTPGKTYYFLIGSGTEIYKDPDGNEFSFTTAPIGTDPSIKNPEQIIGNITNGTGEKAIVYVILSDGSTQSFPISSVTNASGNFKVDLAHARTTSLKELYPYEGTTGMTVFAQGGNVGGAVIKTTVTEGTTTEMTLSMKSSYPVVIFPNESKYETGGGGGSRADLDGDGKIGVNDYYIFVSDYLQQVRTSEVNSRSDFDGNGRISAKDYAFFVDEYLRTRGL